MAKNSEQPIICLKNLYSLYNQNDPNYFVANKNINFEFLPHKIYFIIGNSGSGKSTLVQHFNGLKPTKYGSCLVKNRDIGTGFDLNGYFLGTCQVSDINDSVLEKLIEFNLEKKPHLKVQVLMFNKNTTHNIARIYITAMFNYTPKHLHCKPIHGIRYFYFYYQDDLTVVDNLEWAIPKDKDLKLKQHLSFPQWWKTHKIKKVKEIRKTVATVFQFPEYQLFKDQIIKDVMFGPLNLGVKKPQAMEYAKKYLKMLNMPDDYYTHSPFGLSGGQKRRVAIAGILAIQSDVVIFDEPTAGLDPAGENEMLNIIHNLKNEEQKTVIVISHNMDHVLQEADEVLVLNNGHLVKSGTPYEIFMHPDQVTQWGLNLPFVMKTYFDILPKIKGKKNQNRFQNFMETQKPKTIEQFSFMLQDFFIDNQKRNKRKER